MNANYFTFHVNCYGLTLTDWKLHPVIKCTLLTCKHIKNNTRYLSSMSEESLQFVEELNEAAVSHED